MSKTALLRAVLGLALLGAPARAAKPGDLLTLGKLDQTPAKDLSDSFQTKVLKDLASRKGDFSTFGPMVVFQQMFQERAAATVPSRGFTYASRDARGRDRTYSARVYLPAHAPHTPAAAVPIVLYQHATETRRAFTPYYMKGDETMLGAMAASMGGFAVVMPDGDGMGADPSHEMHAYCHGPTTSQCLLDCIRAARGQAKDGSGGIFDDADYHWDGRIFILGYSEGGYIALAAVKALCTDPAFADLKLTGAACMGGPFAFSTASAALFAKDHTDPYDRPYIPAYFLAAWHGLYPDLVDFDKGINAKLKSANPADSVASWLGDGILGGDQISPLIQKRLTGKADQAVTAREILDKDWLATNLDDPNSRLMALFRQNDLIGDWAPTMPVLLVHDPFDKTVSFDNAQAAFDAWKKKGADPIPILKLAVGTKGTGHVGGAIVAIPTAFTWIAAGMPRTDLTRPEALLDLIKSRLPKDVMPKGLGDLPGGLPMDLPGH